MNTVLERVEAGWGRPVFDGGRRREAEQRFSPAAMAGAHERVYERLIGAVGRNTVLTLPRSRLVHVTRSDGSGNNSLRSVAAPRNVCGRKQER